jgi:protein Tex
MRGTEYPLRRENMINIPQLLSEELSLQLSQVSNALQLQAEGGTIPFIARYRKERTGEMTEIQLRALFDRFAYLTELEERKQTILRSIEEQGKLTDELRVSIESCLQKNELEDLYLPYKPKKRTRATVARERGLQGLADFIRATNVAEAKVVKLEEEAIKYISEEKGIPGIADALGGASDILAEEVSEKAELRSFVRDYIIQEGVIVSRIKEEFPAGATKYEMYREYRVRVKDIQPHNMLALRRGESEGVLTFDFEINEAFVRSYLESKEIFAGNPEVAQFLKAMVDDAFSRLMRTTLCGEVRLMKKEYSDAESIKTFEANLRELLLASPAGMKPTLGIDPGFRTGCKVVVIDETGKFLEYHALFPHQAEEQRARAGEQLRTLITKYKVELIAIGNGTASRETDEFVEGVLAAMDHKPIKVIVNESGASVYSASETAVEEFPDLDVTVRGAISIGRRLQDPLAELVKIDPKSIGVGQYQHDVDQRLLKKKLEETVESCVNHVGVDVNTASKELLSYVAGVNTAIAKNVVKYRDEHGAFRSRDQLRQVPKFGPKTYEQAAGFLRIRGGENPLDNSAVHPESYPIAGKILNDLGIRLEEAASSSEKLKHIDLKRYTTESVGEPTLRDIVAELQKPGRDPRAEFKYATFKEGIKEIRDLAPGMELEGVITNVANFGAFVDIGVHQDGLIHISQLANRFVDDPKKVVKVGQIVKVRVLDVNVSLKRVALTMKSLSAPGPKGGKPKAEKPHGATKAYTLEDLKAKFKSR